MHKGWKQTQKGFTIIELLIVIIVVAILAAVSVAAYAGVRDRASDTAVQADLDRLAKHFEAFYTEKNRYPNNESEVRGFNFKATKSAYMTDNSRIGGNLVLCITDSTLGVPNPQVYSLAAISTTGKRFYVTTGGGAREYTGSENWFQALNYNVMCSSTLSGSRVGVMPGGTVGWLNGVWRVWTGS